MDLRTLTSAPLPPLRAAPSPQAAASSAAPALPSCWLIPDSTPTAAHPTRPAALWDPAGGWPGTAAGAAGGRAEGWLPEEAQGPAATWPSCQHPREPSWRPRKRPACSMEHWCQGPLAWGVGPVTWSLPAGTARVPPGHYPFTWSRICRIPTSQVRALGWRRGSDPGTGTKWPPQCAGTRQRPSCPV